jgi:hypothetical protein
MQETTTLVYGNARAHHTTESTFESHDWACRTQAYKNLWEWPPENLVPAPQCQLFMLYRLRAICAQHVHAHAEKE